MKILFRRIFAFFSVLRVFGSERVAYRNIGFLGRGYDVLRSDPRPVSQPGVDNGILAPIFDVSSYSEQRWSSDLSHQLPDSADVVDCTSCMATFETHVIKSPEDYKTAIRSHVLDSSGFGLFNSSNRILLYKHAASSSLHGIADKIYKSNYVAVDVITPCTAYCADLRISGEASQLEKPFIKAVQRLPDKPVTSDAIMAKYHRFIERFGTHYISSIKAGSLFWQRTLFPASNFDELELEVGDEIKSSAAEILSSKMSKNSLGSRKTKAAVKFPEMATTSSYYSVGIPPDGKVTTEQWLNATWQRPMPISIKIVLLTDLFTEEFFGNATEIDRKRENLETVLKKPHLYCRFLSYRYDNVNCDPEEDRAEQRKLKPRGVFGGAFYMSDYTSLVENVPNAFTKKWECPNGFSRVEWARPLHGNPGYFYSCLSDWWSYRNASDPEGAFGGFYFCYSGSCSANPVLNIGKPLFKQKACPLGYYNIYVGRFYLSSKSNCLMYACYRYIKGASLGGFFLKYSSNVKNTVDYWINPATGVTACPSGYSAHLLLSSKDSKYPFKSYYCHRNY